MVTLLCGLPKRLERLPLLVIPLRVQLLLHLYCCRCYSLLRRILQPGRLTAVVPLLWLPLIVVPLLTRQCIGAVRPTLGPTLVVSERVWFLHGGGVRGDVHVVEKFPVPSRTSSRGGSASPGGEKCSSHSRCPSQSRRVDDDRQEEQFSIDFVSVSHLCFLAWLPEAPSEGRKIHGFMAALEDDDQPAASY